MTIKRLTEVKKQEVNPKDTRFREKPTCASCGYEMEKKGEIYVCKNCGDTSSHS